MTKLNNDLNVLETTTQKTTDDLFEVNSTTDLKNVNPHIFDNKQIGTNVNEVPKKPSEAATGTSSGTSSGISPDVKTRQQNKTNSKNTFFTLPIVILMIVILILIVVIIVVIRFKTKNTDILLEQSKEQLEELIKNINQLEEENKALKQTNSKLHNTVETFKAENKQLMKELLVPKRDNFDVQPQTKSKTHAELKAEKFGISNNYIEKNNINRNVETFVEQPQETINMTNELSLNEHKNKTDITTEEESDIENLLNN